MSSDRRNPIAAPNAGRRRSACSNWFPRAPHRLSPSHRPSISNRSKLSGLRLPVTPRRLNIPNSRRHLLNLPSSSLSSRALLRATHNSSNRECLSSPCLPNDQLHLSIPNLPPTERNRPVIRLNQPAPRLDLPSAVRQGQACRHRAHRLERFPKCRLNPATQAFLSSRSTFNTVILNHLSTPKGNLPMAPCRHKRPSKVDRLIQHRDIRRKRRLPSSRRLRNNRNRERPTSSRLPPSRPKGMQDRPRPPLRSNPRRHIRHSLRHLRPARSRKAWHNRRLRLRSNHNRQCRTMRASLRHNRRDHRRRLRHRHLQVALRQLRSALRHRSSVRLHRLRPSPNAQRLRLPRNHHPGPLPP